MSSFLSKVKVVAGKDIKQLAKDALDVQNASNLMGVSKSFAQAVEDLYHSGVCKGMDECFQHPIITLWIDKLCHLNKCQYDLSEKVDKAYDVVNKLVKGE